MCVSFRESLLSGSAAEEKNGFPPPLSVSILFFSLLLANFYLFGAAVF
jgi:hypothetical protein